MVILDTDHLTVIQRESEPRFSFLNTRLSGIPSKEIFTTIINIEEQIRGWLAVIRRSKEVRHEIAAYRHLHSLFSFFAATPVLDFHGPAAQRFAQLRRSRLRLGAMVLKIAAIAMSQGATLLSGNLADFRRVPGLIVQNWTQAE